jgi:hypothetical protein
MQRASATTARPAQQPILEPARSLERVRADIAATATLVDAPYDEGLTASLLSAYREFFVGSPVSFRTTTKPKRELNVRYVELEKPHDPYKIARDKALLSSHDHPVDTVLDFIQERFPILGYGIDIGVAYGLEKIWPFFPHRPQPVADICRLPQLPPSIRSHLDYFRAFDLNAVSLFAVDYRYKTINLYFMKPPGAYQADTLRHMFEQLGFNAPEPELLGHCTNAVPIYYTFSWDSARIERLCFGVPVMEAGIVPAHLDPVISRFVAGAPFLSRAQMYLFNITAGRTADFVKIENDYTGTMISLMSRFG